VERSEAPTVRTLERSLDLLDCFGEAPSLGLGELSVRAGLSKSTTHRLLSVLERRGALVRDQATQRYSVGPSILRLASADDNSVRLRELALPVMRQLRDATSETVCLTVRVGDRRVFLAQVESLHELRQTVELGRPLPLTYGSTGKVILAFMPVRERERLLRHMSREPITPNTPIDPRLLAQELEGIRQQGYTISHGERVAGATSIAAPVPDRLGRVNAGLSITGPNLRVTAEATPRIVECVVASASQLTALIRAEVP
jgi:DNA-binding IclR family transcriptional regulator